MSFLCNYNPLKSEPYHVRCVADGEKLYFSYILGPPAASLIETKFLLSSTISDENRGSRVMSCNLKDFFLALLMELAEYMKINMEHLPPDIIQKYNLHEKVASYGYVYRKIKRGIYG